MMESKIVKAEDLSSINYGFELGTFKTIKGDAHRILTISFSGEFGYGSAGNNDGQFMAGIVALGSTIWVTEGLIIDLSSLGYEYGNSIERILRPIELFISDDMLSCHIVCSEQNKGALAGIFGPKTQWEGILCGSRKEAIEKIVQQYKS